MSGKEYEIRARHSGKYVDVFYASDKEGLLLSSF
jgi:hypothetical protein